MSISKRQRKANRNNSKKSTGPKTSKGKQHVSQNSTKHGLYSKKSIINSPRLKENKHEYIELSNSIHNDLKPKGIFQQHLVQKIINCLWRSRRIVHAETAHINKQIYDLENFISIYDETELSYWTDIRSIPDSDFIQKMLHYEMRLDRQLTRYFKLLKHLQLEEETKKLTKLSSENKKMEKQSHFPETL